MKILMVYPLYPDTFWGFKHALKFISKKASSPPLGLLTVAAMLPGEWQKKLVDMNVATLTDKDIKWADYVFISGMVVQRNSTREVIARCNQLGTKVVAGGPLFTTEYEEFDGVDHFVLGEAEVTLAPFLADLAAGQAKHVYNSEERPDINRTPIPLWSLANMKHYSSMAVQYSRGCPFDCEFCDITVLNGRKPRTKDTVQMVNELESLYQSGWRDSLFIVDDNFIGNKKKLKEELLPAVIEWSRKRKFPFNLLTEVSINMADDDELMRLMTEAKFKTVFVGIETPSDESLAECNKQQNRGRDLLASVRKIQNHGMEVRGGFIVGFDSDPVSIFKSQINFIQKSGIVTAMVGLLNAPIGTRLYQRMKNENRLTKRITGDNTDCSINFIPKMNYDTLVNGYQNIINTIYSPKPFYERIGTFLREYHPKKERGSSHLHFWHIAALFKSMWFMGIKEKGRRYYWLLIFSTLVKRPRALPLSVTLSIYGFHFRQISRKLVSHPAQNVTA